MHLRSKLGQSCVVILLRYCIDSYDLKPNTSGENGLELLTYAYYVANLTLMTVSEIRQLKAAMAIADNLPSDILQACTPQSND